MNEKGYVDISLPFGKYKGKLIADIPNHYLNWLCEQEFVETQFSKIFKIAKMEKEYRKKFDIIIE